MKLLHRLAHLFGVNNGSVYSWFDDDGKRMRGFRCAGCETIELVHEEPAIPECCSSSTGPSGCYRLRCQLGRKCAEIGKHSAISDSGREGS